MVAPFGRLESDAQAEFHPARLYAICRSVLIRHYAPCRRAADAHGRIRGLEVVQDVDKLENQRAAEPLCYVHVL